MEQLTWDESLFSKLKDLPQDNLEEFYKIVVSYDADVDIDVNHLKNIFKLTQELLKFKGAQVSTLTDHLDRFLSREYEGKSLEMLEENQNTMAKSGKQSSESGYFDIDELKEDLLRSEHQNEKLLTELKAREDEVEKLSSQILVLERKQLELKNEIAFHQKDKNEEALAMSVSPRLELNKVEEMVDSMQKKNKHISQLLNDIELLEMDNLLLQEKVVSLREKLEESTKHIHEICGELTTQKYSREEKEAKICHLQSQNEALRSEIKELVKQNKERESELIDFSGKLEQHVKEWMNLLEEKDHRISSLESQIAELSHQISIMNTRDKRKTQESLHEAFIKREKQIEVLKNELAAAVKDINLCMETIEEMRTKESKDKWIAEAAPDELVNLRKELKIMNEKLKITEKELKDAEEDARMKAQQFSEVIVQLRQYEAGEYGLSDAVREIKELRKQKINTEKQLEELLETLSDLKLKCSYLEEENAALRFQISPKSITNGDSLLTVKERQHSAVLGQQIAASEEENIQLKMKNYDLMKRINNLTEQMQMSTWEKDINTEADGNPVSTDTETKEKIDEECEKYIFSDADIKSMLLQQRIIEVLKENDALRNGMHEILESIHNQDGSSSVQIESRSLERLLEALDARHISGWYHPAMRLQAQLHAIEGSNSTLREQLRIIRKEELDCREQLQKSLLQIRHLEQPLLTNQERQRHPGIKEIKFSSEVCTTAAQNEVMKLKIQLIHVLWVHKQQAEWNNSLTLKLENLKDKLEEICLEMRILYLRYQKREKELQNFQNKNKMSFEVLNNELRKIHDKLAHYEDIWDTLSPNSNEKLEIVSRQVKQMSETMTFVLESSSKFDTLQKLLDEKAQENQKLKVHLEDMEFLSRKSIATLRKKQEDMLLQIESLQDMLENSVPLASIEELNTVFSELKCKYRDLLLSEQNVVCESNIATYLEARMELLARQNEQLKINLLEAKQKVFTLQAISSLHGTDISVDEACKTKIASLAKMLAVSQIKEQDEKERAEHAAKMYSILKAQCEWLTSRKMDLESQNDVLMKQNLELQYSEKMLTEKLIMCMPYTDVEEIKMMLHTYKIENEKLKSENGSLKESLAIAQDQIFNLQTWKECQSFEVDIMRKQILNMLNADGVTTAKLTNEILQMQLCQNEMLKAMQKLRNENSRLKSAIAHDELHMEKRLQFCNYMNQQIKSKTRMMYQAVQDLRCQYSGPMSLAAQERLTLYLKNLWRERHEAIEMLQRAQKSAEKCLQWEVKYDVNTASLEEIICMIKSLGTSKDIEAQIVAWHNNSMHQHLQELKLQRELETKSSELEQVEQYVKRQNEQIEKLEQCHINLMNAWEKSQRAWDQIQEHFCKQLSIYEGASDEKYLSSSSEKDSLVNNLQEAMALLNHSLLMHKIITMVIKRKMDILDHQVAEKDSVISDLQKMILDLIHNIGGRENNGN